MGWLKTFLAGLGAAFGAFGTWWAAYQRDKAQTKAQASADAVAHDPVGEWLRRYNPDSAATSAPAPGKPDPDD